MKFFSYGNWKFFLIYLNIIKKKKILRIWVFENLSAPFCPLPFLYIFLINIINMINFNLMKLSKYFFINSRLNIIIFEFFFMYIIACNYFKLNQVNFLQIFFLQKSLLFFNKSDRVEDILIIYSHVLIRSTVTSSFDFIVQISSIEFRNWVSLDAIQ